MKNHKFKKGDIIANGVFIAVFEKFGGTVVKPNLNDVVYYSTLYMSDKNIFTTINEIEYGIGSETDCRFATNEEIKLLISSLIKKTTKSNKAIIALKNILNSNIDYINKDIILQLINEIENKTKKIKTLKEVLNNKDDYYLRLNFTNKETLNNDKDIYIEYDNVDFVISTIINKYNDDIIKYKEELNDL